MDRRPRALASATTWDVAPQIVHGAALTAALATAAFTARALLVPSPYLEPFDLLVAPASLALAAAIAMPLCHLGLGFLFAALLCGLPAVFLLGVLLDHFATLEPRTTIAAAQSLLLATTMLGIDLIGACLYALR